MFRRNRYAKINVKLLAILILVTLAVGISLVAARQVRREMLSEKFLREGQTAFEKEDWPAACKNFKEYLGSDPDNVEILKKYGKACLSVRPPDVSAVRGAVAAYRRVIQLDPLDKDAYDQLATLYTGIGNSNELVYIARTRLRHDPNDRQAPLWLANALIRLNETAEARQTLEKFISELETLPDKPIEYVRACAGMSEIALADGSGEDTASALKYLGKAVTGAPEVVDAYLARAQFYARTREIPGLSNEDRLLQARKDLEAADRLETRNPRILLLLGSEWMAHGELEKAEAELRAAESLPQETLREHFLDVNDWAVARFHLASGLTKRRGNIAESVSLATEALARLDKPRHRVQILPSAITLFIDANEVSKARGLLDEYMNATDIREGSAAAALNLAYLQALVAKAEEKPYDVINVLEPVVLNETSRPEPCRLLAEAYSRTGQTRRAVTALTEYLRLRPGDQRMTLLLTNEYFKLQDWISAFEAAQTAESLDPTDIIARLLRIEAGMHLATGQRNGTDTAELGKLSAELEQLSHEHPDRHDIRRMQAAIASHVGRPGEAEKELKLVIEKSADPLGAEIQLVKHCHRTGQTAEAIKVCQTLCERHFEAAEPWILLSELHVANSDTESANDCLQRALDTITAEQEKRSVSIRLALLELMHGDRPTREAGRNRLSELAAQDKHEIRARTLLLGIREVREDPATAEKLIAELKEIEGESGLLWRLHQASLWLASDEWRSRQQDITDHLQLCITSDPGWSAPVLLLASLYERLEDFSRLEETCRQALVRNPSATAIANRLLTLLEAQGHFSEAEQVLKNLQKINADPRLTSAWQVRMAVRAGDLSEAIDELKLRISNDDQDVNSRIQLARLIYGQNRDADLAFRYLKQAEAITPDSMALTATKVAILMAEGRAEEALQILDDSVAKSHSFGAYMMRGEYLGNQGEFERAEKDHRKLTTFTENGAAGYELLSNFYARNEKLDQAVAALEEGLTLYPEDLRLKRSRMKFLFARGQDQDHQRALEILTELEARSPRDPELMQLRAMQMLQERTPQSLKTAREMFEAVIKLAPTAVDAHLMLISIAMQEGEYESARDSAIRALELTPGNLALLSARSKVELILENTQMAAELAHMVLAEDPNSAEARDLLVAVALKSEDHSLLEEALALIESIDGYSTDERSLLLRASLLGAMERPQAAIGELEAYRQTEDGNRSVAAMIALANLYRRAGDMDQAEIRIEQAEQMDPNNQNVVHARLLWLLEQNRLAELAEISSAYISARQQNPSTLVAAATILSASDSTELKREGFRLYEHAVTLFPTLVRARLGLASTLYQMGDPERSKTTYQEVLEQYPDNTAALNDLAWILQEHDHRYAAALELANKGLILEPEDLNLLHTRGTILAHMAGRLADARIDFERLEALSPPKTRRQADALLQLGRICTKLNDHVRAKQHLERALEIDQEMDVFTTDERSEILRITEKSGMQAATKDLTSSTIRPDNR